ncbi:sigma 54-interacting transcriptional regulator [Mucilaginibacter sp. KACC 22063]|uniref:sigma 54-interacting transcriptional regulator n=1 Tax=Mucilaginibacter sp. KACC 22063 TaxID=3025666 RepID=UPI0023668F87|nr:sigma 54-interacting transcriptional regulator [Mucilaginibacter sp. KACC 22063]WDF56103.1 sigma 54-interacting transcriptional regulator [Mucilaginibacter sp. KACC 22063]
MKENILIVEDEFIVANDLRIMLQKAGYTVCGIAPSVAKALDLIKAKNPDWILLDIFLQGTKTGIDLAGQLSEMGIPFIYISANTNQAILEAAKATEPYGFLVKPFREKDLLIMLDIALYRHEQSLKFKRPKDLSLAEQIDQIINKADSREEKLKQAATALQSIIPFGLLNISKNESPAEEEQVYLVKNPLNIFQAHTLNGMLEMTGVTQRDYRSWKTNPDEVRNQINNNFEFRRLKMDNLWLKTLSDHFKYQSALYYHIKDENRYNYVLKFYSTEPEGYHTLQMDLLQKNENALQKIISDILLKKQAETTVARIPKATPVNISSQAAAQSFNGIIGQSPLLRSVFDKISIVAPDETSVLIMGESGTGKERIAQTIHKLSPRKNKPMVTVNCAALPINLIESELFGHERGAFTGATDKRTGKFEQADGGTIFLDEIGEMPLEAQVKLLRVLQEREIERLGGNYKKKISVRIIAATNRNLEKEVAEGRFRLDLYYRLNVFPIELPALRQRKEDIPLLVNYFLDRWAKKSNKEITGISSEALQALTDYDWPGNIRELEHLIERSVLLTQDGMIDHIEIPKLPGSIVSNAEPGIRILTMEEMEREHILNILKVCNGKVFGPGGAAEMLNIPSTTLNSKIKKLGIKYEFVK